MYEHFKERKYIFIKNTKKPTSPIGSEENPQGAHSLSGLFYVTRALPYHADCMFDSLSTQCKPILPHIYEWVAFLQVKSGVLKMKWFLKNKMEALSVKV